jgi:hypothetical protein
MHTRPSTFLAAAGLKPVVMLLLSFPGAAALRGDTLTIVNGMTRAGTFKAFKDGRFFFKDAAGKEIQESRNRVVSLRVEPPGLVSVKPRNRNKRNDLRIRSYAGGTFAFDLAGRELTLPAADVSLIEMGTDFRHPAVETVSTVAPGDDSGQAAEKYVAAGVVTVIHFHTPGVMASVRQGNYLDSVAEAAGGQVKIVKIEIARVDSPLAEKYGIASTPQFWFYNRKGQRVGKLAGRLTEEDLARALNAARAQ